MSLLDFIGKKNKFNIEHNDDFEVVPESALRCHVGKPGLLERSVSYNNKEKLFENLNFEFSDGLNTKQKIIIACNQSFFTDYPEHTFFSSPIPKKDSDKENYYIYLFKYYKQPLNVTKKAIKKPKIFVKCKDEYYKLKELHISIHPGFILRNRSISCDKFHLNFILQDKLFNNTTFFKRLILKDNIISFEPELEENDLLNDPENEDGITHIVLKLFNIITHYLNKSEKEQQDEIDRKAQIARKDERNRQIDYEISRQKKPNLSKKETYKFPNTQESNPTPLQIDPASISKESLDKGWGKALIQRVEQDKKRLKPNNNKIPINNQIPINNSNYHNPKKRKTNIQKAGSKEKNKLNSIKIKYLLEYCKKNKLKGYSEYNKKDLINFIKNNITKKLT